MTTIGLLTSGGDAPGMNAAIRAVVRTAIENGIKVLGIKNGFKGLMYGDTVEMDLRSVSNIINRGGTILHSARSEEFLTIEGQKKAADMCKHLEIESLIIIGGDGSFRAAREFLKFGITCVCIPGTIDNDISCTDYTIGYDTAMNTVMEMADKVRDTTESHSRCSVIEVMGRDAGFIALNSGVAVGATSILVPEIEYDFDKDVIERMKKTLRTGKRHFVVIVAEGCGKATQMAKEIQEKTGIETRATILGHVQRGGSPTVRDRVLASRMGNFAVHHVLESKESCVVAAKSEEIVSYGIEESANMTKLLDLELYRLAYEISI
ncbi:MAG: 6-phosphofructokinase [Ruminococcaceae bacterium]|nr:6-phosphofructokinase [Oscillospiraceae bacterium]